MFSGKRSHRRLDIRRQRSLRLILESLETRRAPTANVFNNVADEVTLRQDIAAADSNGFADNVINLSSSIALADTSAGPLVIENATSIAKTLTIEAQGTGNRPDLGFPWAGTPGSSRSSGPARRA